MGFRGMRVKRTKLHPTLTRTFTHRIFMFLEVAHVRDVGSPYKMHMQFWARTCGDLRQTFNFCLTVSLPSCFETTRRLTTTRYSTLKSVQLESSTKLNLCTCPTYYTSHSHPTLIPSIFTCCYFASRNYHNGDRVVLPLHQLRYLVLYP